MPVHKVKSLIQNGRVRGLDVLKIRSVLKHMIDLKGENNEEPNEVRSRMPYKFQINIMSKSDIMDKLKLIYSGLVIDLQLPDLKHIKYFCILR